MYVIIVEVGYWTESHMNGACDMIGQHESKSGLHRLIQGYLGLGICMTDRCFYKEGSM